MNPDVLKALQSVPPEPLANRSKFYKGFIFGEFGVGKTVVAARCADEKGLDIATDTGSDSIYNHPELVDKIDVVPYSGLSHLTGVAEAITEQIEGYEKYDLVIADTVSQMQEEYLDWLMDNFKFTGNYREKAIPRNPRLGLQEQEITGLPDYHLARNKMRLPIKALIKAPVNVIFLAHVREPSMLDVQKGKLVRRPSMTETVFKLIAREASFLGFMEREGSKRTIQFMTDKRTVSKSRIKELDDKTINADDLPEILKKWRMS